MKIIPDGGSRFLLTVLLLFMGTLLFSQFGNTVIVSKGGAGSGTINGTIVSMGQQPNQGEAARGSGEQTQFSCGSTCSATYPSGAVLTLTAVPDPGSVFAGWTNPNPASRTENQQGILQQPFVCSGTNPTLTGDLEEGTVYCRADFNPAPPPPITAPALNVWGLILLGALTVGLAVWQLRP